MLDNLGRENGGRVNSVDEWNDKKIHVNHVNAEEKSKTLRSIRAKRKCTAGRGPSRVLS